MSGVLEPSAAAARSPPSRPARRRGGVARFAIVHGQHFRIARTLPFKSRGNGEVMRAAALGRQRGQDGLADPVVVRVDLVAAVAHPRAQQMIGAQPGQHGLVLAMKTGGQVRRGGHDRPSRHRHHLEQIASALGQQRDARMITLASAMSPAPYRPWPGRRLGVTRQLDDEERTAAGFAGDGSIRSRPSPDAKANPAQRARQS